mgnify:CR=1 FL=1
MGSGDAGLYYFEEKVLGGFIYLRALLLIDNPFSLREKVGMRGYSFICSPHPSPLPEGEGINRSALN